MLVALLTSQLLPLADGLSLFDSTLSALVLMAIASLAAYGLALAGFTAPSKYSWLGSLRSVASLIAYEVAAGIALLTPILHAYGGHMLGIAVGQRSLPLALLSPLLIVVCLLL